jgi:uncharacterized protein with GYD domain
MKNFILLTRLVSEEIHPSFFVGDKAKSVKDKVKEFCPAVAWIANYAILGPWDYVDIFEAPDMETAMKVAALVRSYGGAHTEVWPALPWDDFKITLNALEVA